MGFRPNIKTWQTGAERAVAGAQERDMNISDLVEKSRVQAENFAKHHTPQTTAFIGAGLREQVLEANNQLNAAKAVCRDNPHFIPDTIESLDHQAAFIIALAEELQKPQYNQ